MLIRSIKAVNFMRYSSLQLEDLPVEGVIGIEGPNESGKSTIGEAILFAFFGKTQLTSRGQGLEDLIKWGAEQCSVEVTFRIDATDVGTDEGPADSDETRDGDYLIYREIDRSGTNFVKLIRLGPSVEEAQCELASGSLQVNRVLAGLLRFDFSEAVESFFLPQLDPLTGDGTRRGFLDRMTGSAKIGDAVQSIEQEILQLEREHAQFYKELQRNNRQVCKFDENISRLEDLRKQADALGVGLEELDETRREVKKDQERLKDLGKDSERSLSRIQTAKSASAYRLAKDLEAIGETYRQWKQDGKTAAAGLDADATRLCDEQSGRLEELVAFSVELGLLRERCKKLGEELKGLVGQSGGRLVDEKAKFEATLQRQRRLNRFGSVVCLFFVLAATVFGALAVILLLGLPGHQSLEELLQGRGLSVERGSGLFGLFCGGALVCFLISLGWRVSRGAKSQSRRDEIAAVDGHIRDAIGDKKTLQDLSALPDDVGVRAFIEIAALLRSNGMADHVAAFEDRFRPLYAPEEGDGYRSALQTVAESQKKIATSIRETTRKAESSGRDIDKQIKKARSDRDRMHTEIRDSESQVGKRKDLVEKNSGLEARAEEIGREIDVRRLAVELLGDTKRSIATGVAPKISQFLKLTLPKLTDGRYQDARVDEELRVEIFSSEKCDFMAVTELSGGTLEGLALALRLACSQAFIQFRIRQAQFVFLDEPFKMTDSRRIVQTLDVLRELSPSLRQFFIVKPNFEELERRHFDETIRTLSDKHDLCVRARAAEVDRSEFTDVSNV